jgi:hypothetical protein
LIKGKYLRLFIGLLMIPTLIIVADACSPTMDTSSSPPAAPVNNPPRISQIIAPNTVTALAPAEIKCSASDIDGDLLAYSWIASTGNITGSGASVTWIAPKSAGISTITAIVIDGRGGEARAAVDVNVVIDAPKPPEISKVMVTKMDKTELIVLPGDVRPILTRPWNVITVECFADDPGKSELNYQWKSPGGKIEGKGSTIKFIPIEKEEIVLTVTVTNAKGSTVMMDIHFYADCCGHYPTRAREF